MERNTGGVLRPNVLAVFILITSSYCVGARTGEHAHAPDPRNRRLPEEARHSSARDLPGRGYPYDLRRAKREEEEDWGKERRRWGGSCASRSQRQPERGVNSPPGAPGATTAEIERHAKPPVLRSYR